MKTTLLKGIALSVIAATMVACNPKKQDTEAEPIVDVSQIRTEIETMEAAYADKMNANKSDEITYYADDATSYGQNKAPSVGKEAIHKSMKEEAAAAPKGAKVAFETHDVFPSGDGNQVVEIGSYKVADSTGTVLASGNYMALFQKKDGKYICTRDISASDMPKK
ncbi:MAG TPA: nuclear transport factor 2 family protein [Flavobacterium sp.]|nr:nuclear transport factor 2 family protein [Flavobacterium sp.]